MKKTLLTLAAIGAFAVPFGVAVAQDDSGQPTEPVPTTNEPDQVRDRAQRQADDATPAGQEAEERECQCDGTGPQAQQRRQLHQEGCEGPMNRAREQNRLEEGTGDGPQVHQREQNRLDENTETEPSTDTPADSTVDGAQLQFRYGDGPGRGNR